MRIDPGRGQIHSAFQNQYNPLKSIILQNYLGFDKRRSFQRITITITMVTSWPDIPETPTFRRLWWLEGPLRDTIGQARLGVGDGVWVLERVFIVMLIWRV
jgi:hypothetical protein